MKKAWGIFLLTLLSSVVHAGESDLYDFLWLDPDKSVYVLQNKIYPKDKSFYVDISYGNGLSGDFQDTTGAGVKGGFYFAEEWAFEVGYLQYSHTDNSAYDAIKAVNGAEPFTRRFLNATSAYLIWSPFYGKINTFNKIYYFDWSFGVGAARVKAESNLDSVTDPSLPNTFKEEDYTTFNLKTNVKFHINKRLHLGLEFSNANFQANSPSQPGSKKWKQNNDVLFSVGVSF